MTKADWTKLLAGYEDDDLVLLAAPAGGFDVARAARLVRVKPAEGAAAARCAWVNGGAAGRRAVLIEAA